MKQTYRMIVLILIMWDLRCWAADSADIANSQKSDPLTSSGVDAPLWEAGLGVGIVSLPDYRGSDRTFVYALPIPYFIYRGKFLKADRNGLRGSLIATDRLEVSVDTNASLPVKSRDDPARNGMPNLSPTVEAGPSVNVKLWNTAGNDVRLDLRMPIRTVVTVESSPHDVGWVFSPRLNLDIRNVAGLPGWKIGLLAGPLVSSRSYNAYYYSVAAPFAQPGRPAYQAPGGYGGTQLVAAFSKRYPSWWVGAFFRADTLSHASFSDSPLVRSKHYFAAGIAWVRVFGASSRRVPASDLGE